MSLIYARNGACGFIQHILFYSSEIILLEDVYAIAEKLSERERERLREKELLSTQNKARVCNSYSNTQGDREKIKWNKYANVF